MHALRLLFGSLLTIVAMVVGGVAPAAAVQQSATATATATKCRDVSAVASGQGQFNSNNSFDTTATVRKDPLLKGTLKGHFDVTGAPSPGLPFAGTITFTTKKGTLTINGTGTVNTATGDFYTTGAVTAGTGDFASGTGNLEIMGSQNLSTGAFTETIHGEICFAK